MTSLPSTEALPKQEQRKRSMRRSRSRARIEALSYEKEARHQEAHPSQPPVCVRILLCEQTRYCFRLAPGDDLLGKLAGGFANFGSAFANPLPSFNPIDLLIGVAAGAILKLAVYMKGKNRKKFRQGEEYGSARWGKPEDIKPYMDDDFANNVISLRRRL